MKKVLIVICAIFSFSLKTHASEDVLVQQKFVVENSCFTQEEHSLSFGENDSIYFQVLEVNGQQTKILVKRSSLVDDFCNFVNNNPASRAVSLVCTFLPGEPVCSVVSVISASCHIYEAVMLTIEGNFYGAGEHVIELLTDLYVENKVLEMSRVNTYTFSLHY